MNTIDYNAFDKDKLVKYSPIMFSRNKFYLDKDSIYKVFDENKIEERKRAEKVIDYFSDIDTDYIVNADNKIVKDDTMIMYGSKYINGLSLRELIEEKGMLKCMKYIINASKKLEEFHNLDDNSIMGDIHFGNIMVDSNDKLFFIDHDSYGIKDIKPETYSIYLYRYFNNIECKSLKDSDYSKDLDRLAFLLSVLNLTFKREVYMTRSLLYDDKKDEYPYLKDLKEIYLDIKNGYKDGTKVPYIHELIKNYDYS
ncbi:MAG: hypothetical protein IIZ40_02815 [Bacilli bacterium]|nr:hypothetical protein [Bacilli bacterium]